MSPEEIQAQLKKQGFYMSDVARALDVSRPAVSNVVHGHARSRRIAQAISKLTGIPIETLWPGKYPSKYGRRSVEQRAQEVLAALSRPLPKVVNG